MNIKQFKYVLMLADMGSFSRAAEELNISQPSLSQYVKKIEQQIGMELFVRTNGNVRLTDAGKVYVEAGKKILDLENQMYHKFLDLSEDKTGSVVIGTTPFRSVTMMPHVLAKFKKIYPNIHLIIDERNTAELYEAAEKGEFDVCLVTLPVDDKKYDYELIMEEEIVLAVPNECVTALKLKDALKDGGEQIDFKQLDGQAFVMLTDSQIMQKALIQLCDECEISLKKAAVVKSLEAQIEMVRNGVGMALVPTAVCKADDAGKVRYYSIKQHLPKRKVVLAYRKEQQLSRVIKDLIEVMKSLYFGNNAN